MAERASEIEEEYGRFEESVKFNTDYNLQRFLREKQKLREKNKTEKVDSHVQSSSEILE